MDEEYSEKWSFSWNPLIGIMYGPIPVGLILVGIGLVVYFTMGS